MGLLEESVQDSGFCERVERLAGVCSGALAREELSDWFQDPLKLRTAVDIAGIAGLNEFAPKIFALLQQEGFPAGEYCRFLVALGYMAYTPAVSVFEKFLRGNTRIAATVALALTASEKVSFDFYASNKEGPIVVGLCLSEVYAQIGLDSARRIAMNVPSSLLMKSLEYLPRELVDLL
jgi:hypothetical protein